MVTNLCVLLAVAGFASARYQDVLWSTMNCDPNGDDVKVVRGKVTDAICCGEEHNKCQYLDRAGCDAQDTCKWQGRKTKYDPNLKRKVVVSGAKCALNRDRKNNVCCKDPNVNKLENCVDIMSMKCPKAWQVPGDCCPAPYNKYAGMLSTDPARGDLICCNAPCTAIESAWRGQEGNLTTGAPAVAGKAHCKADGTGTVMPLEVRENCTPGKRGYMQQLLGRLTAKLTGLGL